MVTVRHGVVAHLDPLGDIGPAHLHQPRSRHLPDLRKTAAASEELSSNPLRLRFNSIGDFRAQRAEHAPSAPAPST